MGKLLPVSERGRGFVSCGTARLSRGSSDLELGGRRVDSASMLLGQRPQSRDYLRVFLGDIALLGRVGVEVVEQGGVVVGVLGRCAVCTPGLEVGFPLLVAQRKELGPSVVVHLLPR